MVSIFVSLYLSLSLSVECMKISDFYATSSNEASTLDFFRNEYDGLCGHVDDGAALLAL